MTERLRLHPTPSPGVYAVTFDRVRVGYIVRLLRGHGWRAGPTVRDAAGRYPTRFEAAESLLPVAASPT